MADVLAYESNALRIHEDADGTLRIDVPAVGLMRVMGFRSQGQMVIGLLFVGATALGIPLGALAYASYAHPGSRGALIMVPFVALFTAALVSALFWWKAHSSVHISATASELSIDVVMPHDVTRYRVPREQIELLEARTVSDREGGSTLYLCLQRKRYDTPEYFLEQLPAEEIHKIAGLLRAKLGMG
jgi:hypothetical protein